MDERIIKLAKSMKREYIYVTPNYILGTDVNLGTLSIIYTNSDEQYLGTMAVLEGRALPDFAECMVPEILLDRFKYLLNVAVKVSEMTPALREDITNCESFINTSRDLKADDGAKMFLYDKYIMSNYKSLHPLNKSDKIFMEIYPGEYNTFLAKFTIFKKGYEIHEYIRYLSL